MNKLLNAEEVLDLLLNRVSLSRYDQKLFYNLQLYNVLPRKPITTNQAGLFRKVVQKYKSQLAKLNYDAEELSNLPWTLSIIQSLPEFTNAQIKIENGNILLRCPYKEAFAKEFREYHVMLWDKENKQYHTEFGLYKLKLIVDCVSRFYNDVIMCDEVKNILHEILQYSEEQIWNPTLVRKNNNLFIAAHNEYLENAISNIDLNTELPTLALLASYGIKIDTELFAELMEQYTIDEIIFATNVEPKIEITEMNKLVELLEKIGCDFIQFATLYSTKEKNETAEKLKTMTDIPISVRTKNNNSRFLDLYDRTKYKMPVMIKVNSFSYRGSGSMFASKVVELVNSKPIELK